MTAVQIDTEALRKHAAKGWDTNCLLPKNTVSLIANELDRLRVLLSASKPAAIGGQEAERRLRNLMGAVNAYEKETGIGGWYAERVQESSNALLKALGSNVRFGLGDENPIAAPLDKEGDK